MKQELTHLFCISLLSITCFNQANASTVKAELQAKAQTLQQLAKQLKVEKATLKSNKQYNQQSRSQLAKLRQQWRAQTKAGSGSLLSQNKKFAMTKWLNTQQRKYHFDGLILTNKQGYNFAQTIQTKTIKPRFAGNTLKKGISAAQISRPFKEPFSKQKMVRITVPIEQGHQTIGLLSGYLQKPSSTKARNA